MKTETPIEEMPAGVYYVGDLCYVLHDEWDEMCAWYFDGDTNGRQGVGQLKDGRTFASYNTAYGDGTYLDKQRREYGVDAGLIGCILVSSINMDNPRNFPKGGHFITFDAPFKVSSKNGTISFGDVVIDTEDADDEDLDDIYGEDE